MGPQAKDIRRSDVLACYRAFLGRDPENESVIQDKINLSVDVEDLLIDFIRSTEFVDRMNGHSNYSDSVSEVFCSSNHVEYDVAQDVFDRLLDRVAAQWTIIGNSEPHWGVLSEERFRQRNLQSKLEEFYATGYPQVKTIKTFCNRNRVNIPTGVCLELGCGVGRVTLALAHYFERVIAIDISAPMLEIASRKFEDLGKNNCNFYLLKHPNDLQKLGEYDFFFSVIVLQHNPPPVMKRILQLLLQNLRVGGTFFFQVPTHQNGYSFRADSYIDSDSTEAGTFEMHVLPMHVVLEVIHTAGCRVKEVVADNCTGQPGSHTFFGIK